MPHRTQHSEGGGTPLTFHKGVALGNDYLVVNAAYLPWPLGPARCRAICDRHEGLGSDGILVADLNDGLHLRILNPDGSEAEKSGNGLRIFAAWLHAHGLVRDDWFTVRLIGDAVRAKIEGLHSDGTRDVRVEMGRASFRGSDVAFQPVAGEVLGRLLALGDHANAEIHTVSLGNPHCVVFVDELDPADFRARAPLLATHPAFGRGTNVQFARVRSADSLELMVWERGAGETQASGSSACAAAAAAVRTGRLRPGAIAVHMAGGTAEVDVNETFAVRLRGPARLVARIDLHPDFQAWLGTLG